MIISDFPKDIVAGIDIQMDARMFFQIIVKANYDEFLRNPDDLRLLWNAVVSMNTAPEYFALERLGYRMGLGRPDLDLEAGNIRASSQALLDLKFCAETLKHVRKLDRRTSGQRLNPSSTAIGPLPNTWEIDGPNGPLDLTHVLQAANAVLSSFRELH